MRVDQAKRLKELELENIRLKKLVADLSDQPNPKASNSVNDATVSHMKRQIDDLVKEGKLSHSDGVKYRQEIDETKNDPHFFSDTTHRLWSIRQRPNK